MRNTLQERKTRKSTPGTAFEECSIEHIELSSSNSYESFLSESSDTLNDDLIGLSEQRIIYPKKLDH